MALYQLQFVSGNLFQLILLQPKMLQAAICNETQLLHGNSRYSSQILSIFEKSYQTVSLNPNFWVRSEVPATVSKQSATNASELLASATNWFYKLNFRANKKTSQILMSLDPIVYSTHLKNSPKKEFSSKRKKTQPT